MSRATRSLGPTPSSMLSIFANCPCVPCAPTPMTCCTSPAGGTNRRASLCPQITESTLLDYVRHQLDQQPQPTPQTVNHRLTVIRCLYRFHHGQEIPAGQFPFPAHLYDALPGRLRPPPSRYGLRSPSQATSTRHPAPVCRASRAVLGQLSYLPRSGRSGFDVTRWPAFLRDPGAPTRRSETGRCASCTFWARARSSVPCRCPARSWMCCKATSAWNGR